MTPAFLALAVILQSPAPGIELIGTQSPEFQAEIEKMLTPEVLATFSAWLPYTVVLKNNSSEPLVAYDVRWSVDYPRRGGWGSGMVSGTGPAGYINPGQTAVLMLAFDLTASPSSQKQASMLPQGESMLSAIERAGQAPTIFLDSAIFASGRFVGPDMDRNFAHDAARFTAWRTVDQQVQSELKAGQSWDSIAAELSQVENQIVSGSVLRGTYDWNAQVRKVEARHLLKLYRKNGLQAVSDLVQQQLQQPEIVVHR